MTIFGQSDSNDKLIRESLVLMRCLANRTQLCNLEKVAPILLSGLTRYINDNLFGPKSDVKMECLNVAYYTLGSIGHRCQFYFIFALTLVDPASLRGDQKLLRDLYQQIRSGPAQTRAAIQTCLRMLMPCFANTNTEELIQLLKEHIVRDTYGVVPPTAAVVSALTFVRHLFPYDCASARVLCVMAMDATLYPSEVLEVAKAGVEPVLLVQKKELLNNPPLPDLLKVLRRFALEGKASPSASCFLLPSSSTVYAIRFIRFLLLLWTQKEKEKSAQITWDTLDEEYASTDRRSEVKRLLQSLEGQESGKAFASEYMELLSDVASSPATVHLEPLKAIAEWAVLAPPSLFQHAKLDLEHLMVKRNEVILTSVAHS